MKDSLNTPDYQHLSSDNEDVSPAQLAQMRAELKALRAENIRLIAEKEKSNLKQGTLTVAPSTKHVRPRKPKQPRLSVPSSFELMQEEVVKDEGFYASNRYWIKPLACLVFTVVLLVGIYKTGLLIPLGLIGLATSGLIK